MQDQCASNTLICHDFYFSVFPLGLFYHIMMNYASAFMKFMLCSADYNPYSVVMVTIFVASSHATL